MTPPPEVEPYRYIQFTRPSSAARRQAVSRRAWRLGSGRIRGLWLARMLNIRGRACCGMCQAQPITLVVQNAVASKAGTTYIFEVAADVAFTKVQTKDGIAEGSSGQTSV